MNALRAIIVEDEPSGMENLRWKLQNNCPEVEIVAECLNGAEAIAAIRRHMPEILFLDIMLGDMTGFEVLDAIRYPTFEVIFTTSFDEFAIQAIKKSALDYLLKPIEVEELQEAVAKARMKKRNESPTPPPIATPVPKLGFPVSTGQQFIRLEDIIYAEAQDKNAVLYLVNNQTIPLTRSLGWLEEHLMDYKFSRIHHSYLINVVHLKEYIRNEGGFVVMSNGKGMSISRRKKDDFLQKLEDWNISI
jgi:two-component system LytT family response regulator